MARLQKFVEQGAYGEKPGRTAYAFRAGSLPVREGFAWQNVPTFNAADELIANAGLKEVFKVALEKGYAIVEVNAK